MDHSQQFESSSPLINTESNQTPTIIIGYYNLRGKAQVPRLLLEYLGVDYEDRIFTLTEWQKFSAQSTQNFAFAVLPFLKEGNFVVTDSVPMCCYIINRFGNQELLGRTLRDRAIIQMYFWTIPYMQNVITINCQQKTPEQLKKFKDRQWDLHVFPRMIKLQDAASKDQWFLGYLTIVDFSIYELVRYMDNIFDGKTKNLPKLKRIQKKVENLEAIKSYEHSQRAVVQWCPTKLLESFKNSMAQAADTKGDGSSIKEDKKLAK